MIKNRIVIFVGGPGSPYQGPGDIVSGALLWGSCARAYSAAYAASRSAAIDVVDQAGANTATINVLPSGKIDLKAISAWVNAHAVTTIKVTKLYDQSGSGNHLTQATLANMPTLTLNALNGLPGMTFSGGAGVLTSPNITQAQPLTFTAVAKNISGASTPIEAGGAAVGMLYTGTNGASAVGGATLTATAADGGFHSLQAVLNGASSAMVVDGTATSGTAGATGISVTPLRIGRTSGGTSLTGIVFEVGAWSSAHSPTQYGNVTANQRNAVSGYAF